MFGHSLWEETPITMALSHTQKGYATKMLNCFLISGSQSYKKKSEQLENESTVSLGQSPRSYEGEASSNICVIFDEQITFLDEALHILKSLDLVTIGGDDIVWINSLVPDFGQNTNSGFIISCEATLDDS